MPEHIHTINFNYVREQLKCFYFIYQQYNELVDDYLSSRTKKSISNAIVFIEEEWSESYDYVCQWINNLLKEDHNFLEKSKEKIDIEEVAVSLHNFCELYENTDWILLNFLARTPNNLINECIESFKKEEAKKLSFYLECPFIVKWINEKVIPLKKKGDLTYSRVSVEKIKDSRFRNLMKKCKASIDDVITDINWVLDLRDKGTIHSQPPQFLNNTFSNLANSKNKLLQNIERLEDFELLENDEILGAVITKSDYERLIKGEHVDVDWIYLNERTQETIRT